MSLKLNSKELTARIAQLESQIDFLQTELSYLDHLLIDVGFTEGIKTLRATAEELLAESSQEEPHEIS